MLLRRCADQVGLTSAFPTRAHVWGLLTNRDLGFPRIATAGRIVSGWVVVDMDATLIASVSAKQGAAATYKRGSGFRPSGAWCANTGEALAMLLRPGNAGSNTASDHIGVLAAAIARIPAAFRRRLIVCCDRAGASHEPTEHIASLNNSRRRVHFVVGWKVTEADEVAMAKLPAAAWKLAVEQDGEPQDDLRTSPRSPAWTSGLRCGKPERG